MNVAVLKYEFLLVKTKFSCIVENWLSRILDKMLHSVQIMRWNCFAEYGKTKSIASAETEENVSD